MLVIVRIVPLIPTPISRKEVLEASVCPHADALWVMSCIMDAVGRYLKNFSVNSQLRGSPEKCC